MLFLTVKFKILEIIVKFEIPEKIKVWHKWDYEIENPHKKNEKNSWNLEKSIMYQISW